MDEYRETFSTLHRYNQYDTIGCTHKSLHLSAMLPSMHTIITVIITTQIY